MGMISIEDMRFFAYHGCYAEEAKVGRQFRVDLFFETDTSKSEASDKLDDTVQQDFISIVCAAFQIILGELNLFRLGAIFSSWAEQLTQSCLYLVRKVHQATAAFEPQGRADLTLDKHITSLPPDEQVPKGLCLDGEALEPLPSAVLASNIEAQTLLGNLRTL